MIIDSGTEVLQIPMRGDTYRAESLAILVVCSSYARDPLFTVTGPSGVSDRDPRDRIEKTGSYDGSAPVPVLSPSGRSSRPDISSDSFAVSPLLSGSSRANREDFPSLHLSDSRI